MQPKAIRWHMAFMAVVVCAAAAQAAKPVHGGEEPAPPPAGEVQASSGDAVRVAQETASEADRAVHARLGTKVSLLFDRTPFLQVTFYLEQVTGVSLVLARKQMPWDGLPVTLEYDGTAEGALDQMCAQTGMVWTVCYGAVLIGSKAALARNPRPTVLQFRLVADEAGPDTEDVAGPAEAGTVLHVCRKVELDDLDVASAGAALHQATGRWQVNLEWTPKGREVFAGLSTQNVGKRLAIFVEGKLLLAPLIQTPAPEGVGIVGDFSQAEAERIARALAPPDPETLARLKARVSLSLVATPVSEVLRMLEDMTGQTCLLAQGALPLEEASVTFTYEGTVEDVLSLICIQSDMTWRPRGSVIELRPP